MKENGDYDVAWLVGGNDKKWVVRHKNLRTAGAATHLDDHRLLYCAKDLSFSAATAHAKLVNKMIGR